jgi:hypothetical protein
VKLGPLASKYAWPDDISDGFLLATPQRELSSCTYAGAARSEVQDLPESNLVFDLDLAGNAGGVPQQRWWTCNSKPISRSQAITLLGTCEFAP